MRLLRTLALGFVAVVISVISVACVPTSSPETTTAPPVTTSTTETTTSTRPDPAAVEVDHRLLADGLDRGGQPWSTGVLRLPAQLEPLVPDADLDWTSEAVFRFTLPESGSCPFDEMEALVFSPADLRLYPVVSLVGQPEACTDDANPHTIVVAVSRVDLPEGSFSLWVAADDPPSGLVDGVTHITAGELDAPGEEIEALDTEGTLGVGETRIAYGVSTHCGLDRIYRTVDDRQWVLDSGGDEPLGEIPNVWAPAVQEEQVDLILHRPSPDRLEATVAGTGVTLPFVPAGSLLGCD